MATQVFLHNTAATTHRGTNTAKLNAATSGWFPLGTGTTRGAGLALVTSGTVAGATPGVEAGQTTFSVPAEWITPPVDADVTISGTITGNIWAFESNMSANVAINFYVEKIAAADGTLTRIATSTRTTEVAVGTAAVNNFTVTPTSTALNKGDRLRLVIFGDDAGTMASGFSFTADYAGTTAAADGDTFITFNETFGFQTTDPTGTQIFLTDTASAVATANTDYEAWTTRGNTASGVVETRNPGAGWIAPVQIDDGAAVAIDWFTRPLQAFTLSGLVKANLWAAVSAATANQSIGCQVARVEGDGTGATVWGYANRDAATTSGGAGEVGTSQAAYTVYISGDDLSISAGQRLRIRVFVDDCADIPTVSGTFNFRFDGDTGGAQGDTFLTFEQTLLESTPGTAFPFPRVDRSAPLRDTDPWSLTGWRS